MGCVFRPKLKSGERQATYRIKYYVDGKEKVESTGVTSEAKAKRILKEREGRVARGEVVLPRADRITYDEARSDLLTYYATHKTRDLAEARARLAHLDVVFTGRRIVGIGQAEA